MATFVTSKIKQVYHGFYTGGYRRISTKRPMYAIYSVSVDGVLKYIRTSTKLEVGTEVDLTTLSFFLCDIEGNLIVDNSGGDTGGDTGGGTDPDPDPIDGGTDPDPIDGGGGDDSSGGNPIDPT